MKDPYHPLYFWAIVQRSAYRGIGGPFNSTPESKLLMHTRAHAEGLVGFGLIRPLPSIAKVPFQELNLPKRYLKPLPIPEELYLSAPLFSGVLFLPQRRIVVLMHPEARSNFSYEELLAHLAQRNEPFVLVEREADVEGLHFQLANLPSWTFYYLDGSTSDWFLREAIFPKEPTFALHNNTFTQEELLTFHD